MSKYRPEYAGDNENRRWVRMMMDKKGYSVDHVKLVKLLPEPAIKRIFETIVANEQC